MHVARRATAWRKPLKGFCHTAAQTLTPVKSEQQHRSQLIETLWRATGKGDRNLSLCLIYNQLGSEGNVIRIWTGSIRSLTDDDGAFQGAKLDYLPTATNHGHPASIGAIIC